MNFFRRIYNFYLTLKWQGLMNEFTAQRQLNGDYELIGAELAEIEDKLGKTHDELYLEWRF